MDGPRDNTEQTEINGTDGNYLARKFSVCSVYFRLFRILSFSFVVRIFIYKSGIYSLMPPQVANARIGQIQKDIGQ